MPIEPSAERLSRFAADGYASVIRLPLRNRRAAELARSQLDEIIKSRAPVLLFLDRLEVLTLQTCEADGSTRTWSRHRVPNALESVGDIELAEVNLGPAGRVLTIKTRVDRGQFLEAIERSIEGRLVDEGWRNWDGEAFVAIALPLDGADHGGRLYCYLPLGPDASSPLHGYLNAPFVVTLSRQALVPSVPVNDLLFDAAAAAAAAAASALRRHSGARTLVPDLITWRGQHIARIARAFDRRQTPLRDARLLPIVGSRRWGTFGTAYRWSDEFLTLTPGGISSAAKTEILDPGIGADRLARLAESAAALPRGTLDPDPSRVADWAVAVASTLARRARRQDRFDPRPWTGLYDDLAAYFRNRSAHVLRGRKLLVSDDLNLHVTWGGSGDDDPSIFFPLRDMDSDEPARDASIPKTLARHLAYVHAGIRWTVFNEDTRRNENRPGRDFLERTQLVRVPRTRDLLERIARVLARRRDKQLHADALRLVFNLTSGRPYSQDPRLDSLNLRVPTRAGEWIPASDALFSEHWPGTLGRQLERLIRQSSGLSSELEGLSARLLANPDAFGFRLDSLEVWTAFLRTVGVCDGIWPEDLEARDLASSRLVVDELKLSVRTRSC